MRQRRLNNFKPRDSGNRGSVANPWTGNLPAEIEREHRKDGSVVGGRGGG
jgi:hypothetical protein